jgi:hypothetical protein
VVIVEPIASTERVVLVTGDRKWTSLETVVAALSPLASNTVVVHGYARGADTIAMVVAQELGFRHIPVPAHWRHNEEKCVEVWGECPPDCEEVVGLSAGMIRNHKMFDNYHPELIIGFHDNIIVSKGTKGMIKYGRKKNCPVLLFLSNGHTITNPKV